MHKAFDDRDDRPVLDTEREISNIYIRLDSQYQLLLSIQSTNQEILKKLILNTSRKT